MSQSIQASAPSRMGDPELAGCQASSANLSPPFIANARHTDSCSAPRMLTQNAPESRNFGHDDDDLSGMNATSGGSSDTEEKEPTAIPAALPSASIPGTTATPPGEGPSTRRNFAAPKAAPISVPPAGTLAPCPPRCAGT